MTPQEFLDEFGTLAESAQGVPKLRELILTRKSYAKALSREERKKMTSPLSDFAPSREISGVLP